MEEIWTWSLCHTNSISWTVHARLRVYVQNFTVYSSVFKDHIGIYFFLTQPPKGTKPKRKRKPNVDVYMYMYNNDS